MELPPGVGPHEGRELELMLTRDKKLALFGDIVWKDGTIAETIIPERACPLRQKRPHCAF